MNVSAVWLLNILTLGRLDFKEKSIIEAWLIDNWYIPRLIQVIFRDNFKHDFNTTKLSSTQLGTTQPQLVSLIFILSWAAAIPVSISD